MMTENGRKVRFAKNFVLAIGPPDHSKLSALYARVHPINDLSLIWATKDNIALTQRTDNFFILRWVTVN